VLSFFGTVIEIVISAPTGTSFRPASGEITEAKEIVRVAGFVITVFRVPTPTPDCSQLLTSRELLAGVIYLFLSRLYN